MLQVVQEWKHMRDEAANAKAAGDKDRQKAAGMFMRDLKFEMAQIGAALLHLMQACRCSCHESHLAS